MPTTISPLTPTTHGLRVAASFNPRFERLWTHASRAVRVGRSRGWSSSVCVSTFTAGNYVYKKRLIRAENPLWIQRQQFLGFLRPDTIDAAEGGSPSSEWIHVH